MIQCDQIHTDFGQCQLIYGHQRDHQGCFGGVWINYNPVADPVPASDPDEVKKIIEERGKVYGDPQTSHVNIGLSWTGLIQQHYGITLDHPVPDYLVAMMMVAFKNQRSCRVYKEDNFLDLQAYARFSEEFQNPDKGKP